MCLADVWHSAINAVQVGEPGTCMVLSAKLLSHSHKFRTEWASNSGMYVLGEARQTIWKVQGQNGDKTLKNALMCFL